MCLWASEREYKPNPASLSLSPLQWRARRPHDFLNHSLIGIKLIAFSDRHSLLSFTSFHSSFPHLPPSLSTFLSPPSSLPSSSLPLLPPPLLSPSSPSSPSLQTYIGSILSAVNPYKVIDGLYSHEVMMRYMDKQLGEMPPHIYAIANEVYVSMWRMRQNQCVLIR